MNRREFLKALLSVGATITLPPQVAIADASEEAIEAAWENAIAEPHHFYVRQYGTLTTDPAYDYWPASRGELYGLSAPTDLDDVGSLAGDSPIVQGMVEDALYDAGVKSEQTLNADQVEELIARVRSWVAGSPDDEDSYHMTLSGQDGQGYAMQFFRDEFEYCDEFRITIIEGDCPGSSYLGAELGMPIDAANQLAAKLGIPIRFSWLGF